MTIEDAAPAPNSVNSQEQDEFVHHKDRALLSKELNASSKRFKHLPSLGSLADLTPLLPVSFFAMPPTPDSSQSCARRASGLQVDRETRQQNANQWTQTVAKETFDARPIETWSRKELVYALGSSDHLGVPNAFRTAICFHLFEQLCGKFDRFQTVMNQIALELERAVYLPSSESTVPSSHSNESPTMQDFFKRRTYFAEFKAISHDKTRLEKRGHSYDEHHAFMLKQLRNQEKNVDKVAKRWSRLLLKQTLANWKKIIIRKKYTRVLLVQTSTRWRKQHLRRLFQEWRKFVGEEKTHKATHTLKHIQEHIHEANDFLSRIEIQMDQFHQETKENRSQLDVAKRQLLTLEEILQQLDQRIHNTPERKVQELSNAWARIAIDLVEMELAFLQNMLSAVPKDTFCDVSQLLIKGEEPKDLLKLPSDLLVLRWINWQLSKCSSFCHFVPSSVGFIQNFHSDMKNFYVLRYVLDHIVTTRFSEVAYLAHRRSSRVNPGPGPSDTINNSNHEAHASTSNATATADAHAKANGGATVAGQVQPHGSPPKATRPSLKRSNTTKSLLLIAKESRRAPFADPEDLQTALHSIHPPCPTLLSSLVNNANAGPSDLMFCLFGFLACEHPNLTPSVCPWTEAQNSLNEARRAWETIKGQWTELFTPFATKEVMKMNPDVTSPGTLLKANMAIHNAIQMVQYACSKRSSHMRIWSCLYRKIKEDSLRCLLRRGRRSDKDPSVASAPALTLVDRRFLRESQMLCRLNTAKLLNVFLPKRDETSENAEERKRLEQELRAIEHLLERHAEEIRRVYRYYAMVAEEREDPFDLYQTSQQHGPHRSAASGNGLDKRWHRYSSSRDIYIEERFFRKISMTMSLMEFITLLKDCRLFGVAMPFPYRSVQSAFESVNTQVCQTNLSGMVMCFPSSSTTLRPPRSLDEVSLEAWGNSSGVEMTPSEFIEALVLIIKNCPHVRVKSCNNQEFAALPLSVRLQKALEEVILPNALAIVHKRQEINVFRRELSNNSGCKSVLSEHLRKLFQVYQYFARNHRTGVVSSTSSCWQNGADEPKRKDNGGAKASNTGSGAGVGAGASSGSCQQTTALSNCFLLSINGFIKCLKHYELLKENFLNLDEVQHLLAEVLQLDRDSIRLEAPEDQPSQQLQQPQSQHQQHLQPEQQQLGAVVALSTTAIKESVSTESPAGKGEPSGSGATSPGNNSNNNSNSNNSSYSPPGSASSSSASSSSTSRTDPQELMLTFAEFVEALAAIANYHRGDPFVPLPTKLEEFFLDQIRLGTPSQSTR